MKILRWLKKKGLDIIGDIKVYRFPFFMIYDPSTFRVKGYHTRQAMELVKPGDLILRKYVNYLDGFFIPGEYSHTGIYVGDGQMVHAVSENVSHIDIIDFLRCDSFCILRAKDQALVPRAIEIAESLVGSSYDFDFEDSNSGFYCHELGVSCYPTLDLKKKPVKILGIRLKERYLSSTFTESDDFETVLEVKLS